jgi:hypothetical protein
VAQLDETDYFQRRHQQETDLAKRAEKPEVRTVHAQLADEYARRLAAAGPDATGTDGGRPTLSIVPGS